MNKKGIPTLVSSCIAYIECNITTEGIFRVPVSKMKAEIVALQFTLGCSVNFEKYGGVHCACSLLKQYFREVPSRFLSADILEEIIGTRQNLDLFLQPLLLKVRQQISSSDWDLYATLFLFLHKVQSYSQSNLMNPINLAIVWAPNFVSDILMIGSQNIQMFIKFLIDEAVKNFP